MSTDVDKELVLACRRGDLNGTKRAIDSGANVNRSLPWDGKTPLHIASSYGHGAVVDMLLKAEANPSAANNSGDTPLHNASFSGHEAVVDMLLKANANPSAANNSGDTPLHNASFGGHEAVVDMLLKVKANPSAANESGDTPLHNASSGGHEAVVDILLKVKVNPSAVNKYGDTPLHNASSSGHEAVVDMLLKANANPSAANNNGNTPLHNASSEAVVDMLLKVKANPSAANEYGDTPLHNASSGGHEAVVDILLKVKVNPSAVNKYGDTPLHNASSRGHEAVVDILLKAKANTSQKDFNDGNTPLHVAAKRHHVSVMELLIKHGGDINDTNRNGDTPQSYLFTAYSNKLKILDVAEKKRRQDDVKNLLKCCQENEFVDLLLVKCVLTGLPGVGKTSFLKRIRRKMNRFTVPPVIPSTGFEAPVTVNIADDPVTVNTTVIRKGRWLPTDDLHEEGIIFLRSVKHSKTKSKVNHQPSIHVNQVASPSSIKVAQDLPRPSSSIFQSVKNIVKAKNDLKSAKSFIKASVHPKHAQEFEDVGSLTQVYFIDTGGQVEFHELLPPLLHGSAFHLMFFNASLSLHKAVEVVYRHNDSSISSVRYKTSSSSIEIIQQLLVSFYTLSKKANHQSVAGLFGSYIDQLSSDPEELSKQLQEISDTLEAQFHDTPFHQQKFLTQPLNEDCPIIFQPLDNIGCSEDELEKAEKFIYDVIQERFSPVTLPVYWAIFHLSLRNEYEAQGVCTIEECTSLAVDCRIPAEHVPRVLEFFHSQLGTVLYYNAISSLKDYVIINPNILFSGISKLVTLSFIGSGERYGITQTMRKTGEISTIDLHLHEPLSENCPLTNQHIVDLLVHYELLHVSSESTFFMPCLLLPDPEVVSSLVSFDILSFSPPPMLILFNEGFVPIGLFSGIVNGLLKKWKLDRENRFRNHVKFITPPGCVELRHCLKYIEIRAVGGIDKHCIKVREEAMEVVKQVVSVQPHLNETEYSIGFYCPGSLSSHLHACEYDCSFEKALVCTKREKCFDSRPLSSRYALWFEESSSSKSPTSKVPEAFAASSPEIDLTLVDDSELKEDSLLSVLGDCYDIVDWSILGLQLGVSKAELYRIRVDEPNELSRQMEMFSRWIDSGHASWRGLVDALLYPPLKASRVARDIATRHPVKLD